MNAIEASIINHVERATREAYRAQRVDPVHAIEHTERVVVNALTICRMDKIPLLMPVLAAWLHDYGRPAEFLAEQKGARLSHAEESARNVPILLRPFSDSLGDERIYEIQTAVASHSKLNSPDDSLTTIILKDADRLDGLGFSGLYRTITTAYNNPLYNPSNPFPDKRIERGNEASKETTVAQTMLYTIEWFTMLRMPSAIRLGLSRVQKQIGFLEGLVEELGLSRELLEQNKIIREARKVMEQVPGEPPRLNFL